MPEHPQQSLDKMTAALSYLDTNKEIWASTPIIVTYHQHLSESLGTLRATLSEQPNKLDFGTGQLHQLRITIAEKMDILDDVLEAYAHDIQDKNLLEEAQNSKTDYLRLTNDGFERKVTEVLSLLETHQEQLKQYGLASDQVADVNNDFSSYKEKRSNPNPTQHTASLDDPQVQLLLDEGQHTYERLGKVMVTFRTSHHAFYHGFMAIDSAD